MKTSNGPSPARYARSILKKCGQIKPPICVDTVLDYLEIKLHEITDKDIMEFSKACGPMKEFSDYLRRECAMLQRAKGGNTVIRVYKNCHSKRKRLHIFHECAHHILPGHKNQNYLCNEEDLSPATHQALEREAFEGGAEFLMPQDIFFDDLTSLPTSVDSIVKLSNRYDSSLEATAIRYAKKNPTYCGTLVIESQRGLGGLNLKYFNLSPSLKTFFTNGHSISQNTLIYDSWKNHCKKQGEIDATDLGAVTKRKYNIECMPLGNTGKLLAVIWLRTLNLRLF